MGAPTDLIIPVTVPGTDAATAASYGIFATNNDDCDYELVGVKERHDVAGSNGGAVTLMVKSVADGVAVASGVDMLSAGMDMKSTADANQSGAVHGTLGNRLWRRGESLGLVPTGTLTALEHVSATLRFRALI